MTTKKTNNDLSEVDANGVVHVGRADKKQIEDWKKDLESRDLDTDIHEVRIDSSKEANGKEFSYGYVHAPERIHISKVMSLLGKAEVVQAGEYILNNLWLGGDPRIKTDKRLNFNAAMQVSSVIEFRDTTVKKL